LIKGDWSSDVCSSDLIGTELRSQYFIAYAPSTPPENGQYRKIDVQVPDRKGLTVRTRKGYYSSSKTSGAPGQ
jgi:hypothetical protein